MQSKTTTFKCDLCGHKQTVSDGSDLPTGWKVLRGKFDVCCRCLADHLSSLTLKDVKKLAVQKTPVYEPPHPHDCGCQQCNPYAD